MAAATRVYRANSALRASILATLAIPGFVIAGLLASGVIVVCFAFAALFVVFAWRCWQWGIKVNADNVQVTNLFGSRSFRWDEIDEFYVAPFWGYPYCAIVRPKVGQPVPALGISTAKPATKRRLKQVQGPVDELNDLLRARAG
jgi:hypothetical protein